MCERLSLMTLEEFEKSKIFLEALEIYHQRHIEELLNEYEKEEKKEND